MKKTKKALTSLVIAGMAMTMVPFNAFATETLPTRISGLTAADTAVAIAEATGWTGTAILASSTSYGEVDALTVGPLASYLKAPILLTGAGNALDPATKAELTKLAVKTVYVTSGTAVISKGVLDEIKGMNIAIVELGGLGKADTSVNIASKMVGFTKVAIANGIQDALSIAAIASANNEPILLTDKDQIPPSVKAFLDGNPGITSTDVIGGTGIISDHVTSMLPVPTRMAGYTAYDTNDQVIKLSSSLKFDQVYLANGEELTDGVTGIDALAGAPLAAQTKSAIVLTDGTVPIAADFVNSKLTSNSVVTALGGTVVVPESVLAGFINPVVVDPVVEVLKVESVSAINKTITVAFDKVVTEAPKAADFVVKKDDVALTLTDADITVADGKVNIQVPEVVATDVDQSVVYNVTYKGGEANATTAFIVAKAVDPQAARTVEFVSNIVFKINGTAYALVPTTEIDTITDDVKVIAFGGAAVNKAVNAGDLVNIVTNGGTLVSVTKDVNENDQATLTKAITTAQKLIDAERTKTTEVSTSDAIALGVGVVANYAAETAVGSPYDLAIQAAVAANVPTATDADLVTATRTLSGASDAFALLMTPYDNIVTALASVRKAEGSKLQADVDAATLLVNALPAEGVAPVTFTQALSARLAVLKAEGSKLQADVDDAQLLVAALPDGVAKTTLQGRLNAVSQVGTSSTTTGDLHLIATGATDITYGPAAGTRTINGNVIIDGAATGTINLQNLVINGNLTVNTPAADVTVAATTIVNGTTTIQDVKAGTFTNNGTLHAVVITDANESTFVNNATVGDVEIATAGVVTLGGTFTGVVTVTEPATLNITGNIATLTSNANATIAGTSTGNVTTVNGSDIPIIPDSVIRDFTVSMTDMGNFASGTYKGYSVGFKLSTGTPLSNKIKAITVKLEAADNTVLATNTGTGMLTYAGGSELSTPFFFTDGFTDTSWDYGVYTGGATSTVVPARAVVTVTDVYGNVKTCTVIPAAGITAPSAQ